VTENLPILSIQTAEQGKWAVSAKNALINETSSLCISYKVGVVNSVFNASTIWKKTVLPTLRRDPLLPFSGYKGSVAGNCYVVYEEGREEQVL
jgi:hypothetical protein